MAKVVKKKKPRKNYSAMLNSAIQKYYKNGDYSKAIKEFNKIIKSKSPRKIKYKAKLFLGRTYYELKDYKKALKYFAETKDIYPDESEFWIQRSLKKLK